MDNSISVSRVRNTPYVPEFRTIRARFRGPLCYLWFDDKRVEMRTPTAVAIGLELCRQESRAEPGELIVLTINRRNVTLLPDVARQVGGVLLRKAERADEWQTNQGKPT